MKGENKVEQLESRLKKMRLLDKRSSDKKLYQDFVNNFKNVRKYLSGYPSDSEEEIKKRVTGLFDFFSDEYDTKFNVDTIDMSIAETGDAKLKVISEFKSLRKQAQNKMVDVTNFNREAMWELITNFVIQYRKGEKDILSLFITNGLHWFIFDSGVFIDYFISDKNFKNVLSTQTLFSPSKQAKQRKYKAIESYLSNNPQVITKLESDCLYINIDPKFNNNTDNYLAKVFFWFMHPFFILQKNKINTGNILNGRFYAELLYIMGLEEKDKKIVSANVSGSFYEQIAKKLSNTEEQKLETALDLLIIWFNRILFLKLFEARLMAFNPGSPNIKFMKKSKIPDFASLNNFFFEVLAVPLDKRSNNSFANIPYMNSSLFERKEKMEITNMANEKIEYYKDSVLRNTVTGKKSEGSTTLIDYLFDFLDAYNFGEEKHINADLISPAVLGLIFEKINGYKDGSYYTPTTVTDYMAEKAVKATLLNKVKKTLNTKYQTFEDIENAFYEGHVNKENIKLIIDNLRILDPAVGSGHFLVSVLNELLMIKWKFGFITDSNGKTFKDSFNLKSENGDIVYMDKITSTEFVYRRPTSESNDLQQKFQEAIFHEKKHIIENNLFGVDSNPKAVEIARLRMWIELLKNAYYKSDGTMETLPNIDVNVKEGDSLLAAIADVSTGIYTDTSIANYRGLFTQYQNVSDKNDKQKIKEEMIGERNILKQGLDTDYEKLIWTVDFPQILDNNGKFIGFDVVIANPPYGVKYLDKHERKSINRKYECTKTITGIQKGSEDSYALFIEQGINLLMDDGGMLIYIVPMSVISSDSMSALHKFLKSECKIMTVSSYADRPQQVFESAAVNTSIIELMKVKSPLLQVFTTKMYRKSNKHLLEDIIKNLKFIDVTKFYRNGRYPKISEPVEINILEKVLKQKYKIEDILDTKGTPIYYRAAGGRYFKVITPYSTSSSAEKALYLETRVAKSIGAIMSSNLFFWFYQIYSDNLNLKLSDIDFFGIPNNKLTNKVIKQIESAYDNYLTDIKKNLIIHKDTSYAHIDSFEEYKIGKSKSLIDRIDDLICPLYGLTIDELEFIKNYEIEFRIS